MEIKEVTKENKELFQITYITALREGFLEFVPINMISEFNKNFDNYCDECCNNLMKMFLCYENEIPIGVIVFGKSNIEATGPKDAEIDAIYFRKFAHGKGYAKKVLEFAENQLKKEGFNKIYLWCSKENARAWKFYLKNNYTPLDRYWDDNLDGKIFHNVLFVKNIN